MAKKKTSGCEYCTGKKSNFGEYGSFYIEEDQTWSGKNAYFLNCYFDELYEDSWIINYCPVCGRKL